MPDAKEECCSFVGLLCFVFGRHERGVGKELGREGKSRREGKKKRSVGSNYQGICHKEKQRVKGQ